MIGLDAFVISYFPCPTEFDIRRFRPEVQKQLDELDAAWTDVSKAVDERDAALEEALDKSSKFQVNRIWQ